MHGKAGAPGFETLHGDAFDDVDAERFGALAQGTVQRLVGDHMGKRLAGRHLAVECQEGRAHRVGGA